MSWGDVVACFSRRKMIFLMAKMDMEMERMYILLSPGMG
jgi:hypothetical protein